MHRAAATTATQADRSDFFTILATGESQYTTKIDVNVDISGRNDRPDFTTPVFTVNTTTGTVTGTLKVVDNDGDTMTYGGGGTSSKGTLVVNADGTFTYTPTLGARQTAWGTLASLPARLDTFVVTVDDGHGGADVREIKLLIPGTVPPFFIPGAISRPADIFGDAVEGFVFAVAGNAPYKYEVIQFTPSGGRVTINRDTGAFRYEPSIKAREDGLTTDFFHVKVTDALNNSVEVDIGVPVRPLPSPITSLTQLLDRELHELIDKLSIDITRLELQREEVNAVRVNGEYTAADLEKFMRKINAPRTDPDDTDPDPVLPGPNDPTPQYIDSLIAKANAERQLAEAELANRITTP
jgi:VCBS repeat-containing protein